MKTCIDPANLSAISQPWHFCICLIPVFKCSTQWSALWLRSSQIIVTRWLCNSCDSHTYHRVYRIKKYFFTDNAGNDWQMLIQLLGSLLAVWVRKQCVLQPPVMQSHASVCHIRPEIQPDRNDRKLIFRNLTLWAPPLHAVLDSLIQKQVDAVNTVINTLHLKYNCCVVCTIAAVWAFWLFASRSDCYQGLLKRKTVHCLSDKEPL